MKSPPITVRARKSKGWCDRAPLADPSPQDEPNFSLPSETQTTSAVDYLLQLVAGRMLSFFRYMCSALLLSLREELAVKQR